MAPNLTTIQHELLRGMLLGSTSSDAEIATAVECSERSVRYARSNLLRFGSTKAPPNGGGRPAKITPPMKTALREHLLEKPTLYQEEMVTFLEEEFGVQVARSSVGKVLDSVGWSKKKTRRVAQEQNADLRDFHIHTMSQYASYQLVFVDESGCDKRVGYRRTGWSPRGIAPVQVAQFRRGERYQILPAYAQDGVVYAKVYQGTTDSFVFEQYIRELLLHCGRWPQPKSVLVMDNASFHHTPNIRQMCNDAGVILVYAAPYSPDLNPIEEFFAELKAFVKKNWCVWERDQAMGFAGFLEWCLATVGSRAVSAEGHFRHSGITITHP
ncbi:hypothetical protein Q7P37_009719 [Cladosporium fusiforme]